jgi:hypothetical protein
MRHVRVLVLGALVAGCNHDAMTAGGSPPPGGSGAAIDVTLPQVVGGALWANPMVYPTVPLHVTAPGATRVQAQLGSTLVDGLFDGNAWVAQLPVGGLADGSLPLDVTATGDGGALGSAHAELVLGSNGSQLTEFAQVGFAHSPRIFRLGDGRVVVTFTDRSAGLAKAWMRPLDGAGRWSGDRLLLVQAPQEVLYAYTAASANAFGILFQTPGVPYHHWLTVVDAQGNQQVAPIDLLPANWRGYIYGDVTYDGAGFVAVYRVSDGTTQQLRWLRVDEASHAVTGPIVVAQSGAGTAQEPVGDFLADSFVKVAPDGDGTVVSFVRGHWNDTAATAVPRSELAFVGRDGTVMKTVIAGDPNDLTWHDEARVFATATGPLALWAAKSLTDPDPNPSEIFWGSAPSAAAAPSMVVDALDMRSEPFLVAGAQVLTWLDQRSKHTDPSRGDIQLYAAPLTADLSTGDATIFPHARFVQGTSELNGLAASTNALLVWVDERHGMGITDPKEELYFETAWY